MNRLPSFGINGSIVTFSDNRLFSGNVYAKIGMVLDGHVKPDYFYTDGRRRYHKSALRKTIEERETGLTEVELRRNQNLYQIYDYGKKRWTRNTDATAKV